MFRVPSVESAEHLIGYTLYKLYNLILIQALILRLMLGKLLRNTTLVLEDRRCDIDDNVVVVMVGVTVCGLITLRVWDIVVVVMPGQNLKVDKTIRIVAFHLVKCIAVDDLRGLLLGANRVILFFANFVQSLHPYTFHLAGAPVELLLPVHVELAGNGMVLHSWRSRCQWMSREWTTGRSVRRCIEPIGSHSSAGHNLHRLSLCETYKVSCLAAIRS